MKSKIFRLVIRYLVIALALFIFVLPPGTALAKEADEGRRSSASGGASSSLASSGASVMPLPGRKPKVTPKPGTTPTPAPKPDDIRDGKSGGGREFSGADAPSGGKSGGDLSDRHSGV